MDRLFEDMKEFRRELHEYPELSEQEVETEKRILAQLEKWGIPHKKSVGHGILAWVTKGEGKCIAFRADMDALPIHEDPENPCCSKKPGIMHACGHDYHVAIHLFLLRLAQELPFEGTLKVLFQPAEETIGGAKEMIKQGALLDPTVDAVLGLHLHPAYGVGEIAMKAGVMNATPSELFIKVKGCSSHGAYPDLGVDAILVSAYLISEIQSIASRATSPLCPVVITIGQIEGGCKSNVLAGEVTMKGTVRALNSQVMKSLEEKLQRLARGISLSHGAEVELEMRTGYPPLVNDKSLHEDVLEVASGILGQEKVHEMEHPSMGADDFAYLCQEVPGYYYFLGCAREGERNYPLHHEKFQASESCLEIGLKLQWEIFQKLLKK